MGFKGAIPALRLLVLFITLWQHTVAQKVTWILLQLW